MWPSFLLENQLTLTRRLSIIFVWRYWKEGFHRVSQMSFRSTVWQVVKIYPDLLNHSHVFICFVIGEEPWVFQCIAETKHQSMEWWTIVCKGWTNHFEHFSWVNNFFLKEKHQILLQVLESLRRHVLRGGPQFWEWGRALKIPAAWQYTCSFCYDNEVHAGKLWHVGNQPPPVFTFSCSIDFFCSWKWKPSLKEQDFWTSWTLIM
jgi:hypothetical protein